MPLRFFSWFKKWQNPDKKPKGAHRPMYHEIKPLTEPDRQTLMTYSKFFSSLENNNIKSAMIKLCNEALRKKEHYESGKLKITGRENLDKQIKGYIGRIDMRKESLKEHEDILKKRIKEKTRYEHELKNGVAPDSEELRTEMQAHIDNFLVPDILRLETEINKINSHISGNKKEVEKILDAFLTAYKDGT